MKHRLYQIRALSNLHVGPGDTDFGIIDRHVQRDALTHLPTINGSSIKGALRQLMDTHGSAFTYLIFGSDNPPKAGQDLRQGDYLFYAAKLLALPVRSSHQLFYLATCPALIREMLQDSELTQAELPAAETLKQLAELRPEAGKPLQLGTTTDGLRLEEIYTAVKPEKPIDIDSMRSLFGERLVVFNENDFSDLCNELPTIARNHLDNGISVNLWYEEIVPRESRFYLPIGTGGTAADELDNFLARSDINHLVQIGGNATVGYGLCTLKPLNG